MKKSLRIFYDKEKILRVKGRFSNGDVDYNVKHPALLHNELYFTELVIWSAHKRVLHGGVNNTLNFIRNDYWLCMWRKTVRAILSKCVTCKKSQSRTLLGPEPSDLPKFRLDFDYAFCNTGVDFAGPLYVNDINGKNDEMFKSYICLFTCVTTRNVHLELTPSMDASDVVKALGRFLSRRGCIKMLRIFYDKEKILRVKGRFSNGDVDYNVKHPALLHNELYFTELVIWSAHKRVLHGGVNDINGKNDEMFKSYICLFSDNFSSFKSDEVSKFLLLQNIDWKLVFTRLIRTVKSTLQKILGRSKLNFEELYTILTQV